MKKVFLACLAFVGLSLASCNNNDDNTPETVVYSFDLTLSDYNADGYWNQVYSTSIQNLLFSPDLTVTHSASETKYGDAVYKSWKGFCPVNSKDNADHSGDDWIKYQWGSITGGGANSQEYMLACWDVSEPTDKVPERVCCGVGSYFANAFEPQAVYITNSAYGYYAMKNGTAFNRAFTANDWCKITIIGLNGTQESGRTEVYLAKGNDILNTWTPVDLRPLGKCSVIYFQMSSSDTGQWGMNNPAYFCLDNLILNYVD